MGLGEEVGCRRDRRLWVGDLWEGAQWVCARRECAEEIVDYRWNTFGRVPKGFV